VAACRSTELPFPLEHWEDFEKLLVALAIDVDGLVEVRRYGTSGQEQDGIDVIGFTRLGHHAHAYQCKNVHEFSKSDLTRAIAKFADGPRPLSPKRLVIAVATAANRTQLIRKLEDTRTAYPELTLELWDATRIGELLRDRPRLVEQFFGEDVARRFCVSASFPASAGPRPASVTAEHKSRGQRDIAGMRNWQALVLGHLIHLYDLRLFVFKIRWPRRSAGHGRAGSSPSRTRSHRTGGITHSDQQQRRHRSKTHPPCRLRAHASCTVRADGREQTVLIWVPLAGERRTPIHLAAECALAAAESRSSSTNLNQGETHRELIAQGGQLVPGQQ
jgi:hypothetical protein